MLYDHATSINVKTLNLKFILFLLHFINNFFFSKIHISFIFPSFISIFNMKNYSEIAAVSSKKEKKEEFQPEINTEDKDFSVERKIFKLNQNQNIKYTEDRKNFEFWLQYWSEEISILKDEIRPLLTGKTTNFSKLLYFLYRSRDKNNEYNRNFIYPINLSEYTINKYEKQIYTVSNVTTLFAIENNIPILLSLYKAHHMDLDFQNWYYKHTIDSKKSKEIYDDAETYEDTEHNEYIESVDYIEPMEDASKC
jgi:hypothetical protein